MDFIDLKAQQKRIRSVINQNISAVLEHGQYIMGPEVAELEEKLADYCGVKHCISASSGTDTLLIALMSLGVKRGDEVITSAFTFVATAEVIELAGCIPVFIDIDSETYNIDAVKLEEAITPKTKAIIPVSLYGQCADMDSINKIAKKHGIKVIEDGAQSFGATHNGKLSNSLSDIGSTSFFPSKPLGCYGDGGALFTDDEELAVAMRQIRAHGQEKRYYHARIGINGRLDTIQAAILLAKMEIFPDEVSLRMRIGERYSQLLSNFDVVTPYIARENTSVYAQYSIQVSNRDVVAQKLKDRGVPTAIHYPIPLHKQPAYTERCKFTDLTVSESVADRILSLPMGPYLTEEDQDFVAKAVQEAVQ